MMQTLRLKNGKEYQVNWCGVSSLDGILRAEITDSTFCDVAQDFCDKDAISAIDYIVNDVSSVMFNGYTDITGITAGFNGIIVALKKEAA